MRPYRRQLMVILPLLGVFALVAQVAGVGTTERARPAAPRARSLAVVPGSSVPDITSTTLARTSVRARAGEVVRMRAAASVRVTKLARRQVAQVVCGIRYSRDGDASWTLGSPYETVQLKRSGARDRVVVERSFDAPETDRYRMAATCHVAAPAKGAKVAATGTMTAKLGLPAGAAVPVS